MTIKQLNVLTGNKQKQETKALKYRLSWTSWNQKYTICIQHCYHYCYLPFIMIHSIISRFKLSNHSYPYPQSLSMFYWTYPFVWFPQSPKQHILVT